MVHYRDVELVETWDELHKQVLFDEKELADYEKWKEELLDDYDGVKIGTLLSAIKGVSNLITNTFELVTPTGKVISIAKVFDPKTVNKIETVKAINGGIGDVHTLYSEGIAGVVKSKVIGELGLFGSLYSKVTTLVDDLKEFNDFNESRDEIKDMLKEFDKLITESKAKVAASLDDIDEFNKYLNYITGYLRENCGD